MLFSNADQREKDTEIDRGAHVVDVGDEHVLLALVDEVLQQAAVVQTLVHISVTWWVPSVTHSSVSSLHITHEQLRSSNIYMQHKAMCHWNTIHISCNIKQPRPGTNVSSQQTTHVL